MSQLVPGSAVSSPTRAAALAVAAGALAGCTRLRHFLLCVDGSAPPAYDVVQRAATFASRFAREPLGYVFAYPDRTDPQHVDRVAYLLPDRGGTAVGTFAPLGFGGALRKHARANGPFAILAIDAIPDDPTALVTVELPLIVETIVGHRPEREALLGIGAGGDGALLAAEREPLRYAAVAQAGTAFAQGAVIDNAARLDGRPILVRMGESDPSVPAARTFAARCPTARVDVARGCHDDGFWRASADQLVGFVATQLYA